MLQLPRARATFRVQPTFGALLSPTLYAPLASLRTLNTAPVLLLNILTHTVSPPSLCTSHPLCAPLTLSPYA